MNIQSLIENMTPELYERLKHAAETGKWPEGTKVDDAQRESALQLSMAYQAKYLNSQDMLTIGADGEVIQKTKRQLKEEFTGEKPDEITPCNKDEIARFSDI